jgi:hypothetical protein
MLIRLWRSERGANAAIALLTFLAVTGAALYGLLPSGLPDPAATSAPSTEFSSGRALEHIRAIARKPHPMGSPENAAVRDYLVEELHALGLQAEVQKATAARFAIGGLVAGRPKNVLARLEGASDGDKAFLLVAHYDSVPTGPGASDDGAGVAAMLETARALKAGPQLKNDVILLFTDGEERGLLGAQAFAEGHPWAEDVGVVLNLEARGNSGAARLFETSDEGGWIIQQFAKATPYPVGNSGSAAGYKLSGSDTDLSVFMDAGGAGMNVAYLEGVTHYHTRLDTVKELDERSLQHLGSYVLALTRQFGNADLDQPKAPDAVYFNLFGSVIHYPAGWAIPFMAFAVVLFVVVVALGFTRRHLTLDGIVLGFLALLVSMIVAALGVYLSWTLIRILYPDENIWALQYNAPLYWFGFAGLTVAIISALYVGFRQRISVANLAVGALLWWLLATILTSVLFPSASFGVTWPLFFSLLGLGVLFLISNRSASPWPRFAAFTLTTVLAVLVYAPAIHGVTLVGGLLLAPIVPVLAVVIALLLGLLSPQLDLIARPNQWILPGAAAIIGSGLLLVGTLTSGFDARHPKPDSIFYALNADTQEAIWASYDQAPDDWTAQFLGFNAEMGSVTSHLPSASQPLLHSEAPSVNLVPPRVEFLDENMSDGVRTLRMRITAPSQANLLNVAANSRIMGATVDGERLPNATDDDRRQPAWTLDYWSPPPEGFELTLEIKSTEPLTLSATAGTPGLPAIPDKAYHDRPAVMMPIVEDMTMVSKSFTPAAQF